MKTLQALFNIHLSIPAEGEGMIGTITVR